MSHMLDRHVLIKMFLYIPNLNDLPSIAQRPLQIHIVPERNKVQLSFYMKIDSYRCTMQCQNQALVLGHSFICRLNEYNLNKGINNFGLMNNEIHLKGIPGGTVNTILSNLHRILSRNGQYSVVCLQIGGNDHTREYTRVVFQSILSLLQILKSSYNIPNAYVCQLFKRAKTRKHKNDVPIEVYNKRVEEINEL